MRIVVTSQGPTLDSLTDPRFGRAAYLVVVDTETGANSAVDNSVNVNAAQGAGIQTGRKVVELGAETLLTGQAGPKAMSALSAAGIEVRTGCTGTVQQAVADYLAGASGPDK